jgi:hypothetical protein
LQPPLTYSIRCVAVICVAHGYCYGLGIDIACATDIRVCAQNTRFSVKEVDIGLAADIGTLSRLPKLVRSSSWVKDVALTAREFLADEALGQGFVSRVYDSKAAAAEAAVKLAMTIAGKSPVAVQGTKELLNYSRDHTVDEGTSVQHPKRMTDVFAHPVPCSRLALYPGMELSSAADYGPPSCSLGYAEQAKAHLREAVETRAVVGGVLSLGRPESRGSIARVAWLANQPRSQHPPLCRESMRSVAELSRRRGNPRPGRPDCTNFAAPNV